MWLNAIESDEELAGTPTDFYKEGHQMDGTNYKHELKLRGML